MTGTPNGTQAGETPGQTPGVGLSILLLFGFLAFVFAVAGVGGEVTTHNIESWYAGLQKPPLTPAEWVFPIVWNFLYFLIALAGWVAWRTAGSFPAAGGAMSLFAMQMMLNLAWSVVFFGMHSPGIASIEILFLLAAIAANMVAFWRINVVAGALLLPYLAWTLFATYLTFAVWFLNS